MAKKVVKLDENTLKGVIAECVKSALSERRIDMVGSGLEDYQGTGSEKSAERMRKISAFKDDHGTIIPGKTYFDKDGNVTTNKTSWDKAKESFGGEGALDSLEVFDEFVKPLRYKISNTPNGEGHSKLMNLYIKLANTYKEWAEENRKN